MSALLLHPFEGAGLGLAPFQCTGMTKRQLPSGQPAGTCNFCGNGILYCFHIRSADGKKFVVGSDCVMRTHRAVDDKGLEIAVRRLVAAERREKADARRDKALARAKAARELLAANPALMADQPHPHPYHAGQGKLLRDYYDYMLRSSWGEQSLRDYSKVVEQAYAATQADAVAS